MHSRDVRIPAASSPAPAKHEEPLLRPQRRHWSALVPKNATDRPSARTKLHVKERLPLIRLEEGCDLASSGYTVFDFLDDEDIIEGIVPLHEATTRQSEQQRPAKRRRSGNGPEDATAPNVARGPTYPPPPHCRVDCATTTRRAPIETVPYTLDDDDYQWCDDNLPEYGLSVLVPPQAGDAAHRRLLYLHAVVAEAFTLLERLYAQRLLSTMVPPPSSLRPTPSSSSDARSRTQRGLPSCALCRTVIFTASEPAVPLRCCPKASSTVFVHSACQRYVADHTVAMRCGSCVPLRHGECVHCGLDEGPADVDPCTELLPLPVVGDGAGVAAPTTKSRRCHGGGGKQVAGRWSHAICAVVVAAAAKNTDADGGCARQEKGKGGCAVCSITNGGLLIACAAAGCAARLHPSCAARGRLVSRTYAPDERSPAIPHANSDAVFSLQVFCPNHDCCVNVAAPAALLGARGPRAPDVSGEAVEHAVHALQEHWVREMMTAVDLACEQDEAVVQRGRTPDGVRSGARERVFRNLLSRVVVWWREKRLQIAVRAVRRAESVNDAHPLAVAASCAPPIVYYKQPMVRKVSRTEVALSHHLSLIPQLDNYLAEFLDGIPPYRERLDFPGGEEQRRERLDREGDCANQLSRLHEVKRSLREMTALTQLVHSRAEKEHELVLLRTQLLHM